MKPLHKIDIMSYNDYQEQRTPIRNANDNTLFPLREMQRCKQKYAYKLNATEKTLTSE